MCAGGGVKKSGGRSNVRRSLFDGPDNNGAAGNKSAVVTPRAQKRRRSGPSASPLASKRARLSRTPREERRRRRSHILDNKDQLPTSGLFTPTKDNLASPLTGPNGAPLSVAKSQILAPSTPAHLIGRSLLHSRRSLGNETIAESPETKGHSVLSNRRSQTSFYSGAQSRNCERARTSIMAQRLQSNCTVDKNIGSSSHISNSNKDAPASAFLFSKIFASAPAAASKPEVKLDRRRSMRRALNFDACDDEPRTSASPALRSAKPENRRTQLKKISKMSAGGTPTKADTRPSKPTHERSLLFGTPTKNKIVDDKVQKTKSPSTPKRINDNERLAMLQSPSNLTPSKRVQFSLQYTPSKVAGGPTTPKSILKTPTRAPHRHTPVRTPLAGTPRRPQIQVFRTPKSKACFSPDLFSCGKSAASAHSPLKTPSKSPKKTFFSSPAKALVHNGSKFNNSLDQAAAGKSWRVSPLVNNTNDNLENETVTLKFGLDGGPCDSQENTSARVEADSILTNSKGDVISSDSAIVLDHVPSSDGAELENNSLHSIKPNHSKEEINTEKVSSVVQPAQQMNEFFKTLNSMNAENLSQEDVPSLSLDDVNLVTDLLKMKGYDDMEYSDNFAEYLPYDANVSATSTTDDSQRSLIEESLAEVSMPGLAQPLLDIPAILQDEQQRIKLHNSWLTDDQDSSSSSPEIEISPNVRDSVKKTLQARRQAAQLEISSNEDLPQIITSSPLSSSDHKENTHSSSGPNDEENDSNNGTKFLSPAGDQEENLSPYCSDEEDNLENEETTENINHNEKLSQDNSSSSDDESSSMQKCLSYSKPARIKNNLKSGRRHMYLSETEESDKDDSGQRNCKKPKNIAPVVKNVRSARLSKTNPVDYREDTISSLTNTDDSQESSLPKCDDSATDSKNKSSVQSKCTVQLKKCDIRSAASLSEKNKENVVVDDPVETCTGRSSRPRSKVLQKSDADNTSSEDNNIQRDSYDNTERDCKISRKRKRSKSSADGSIFSPSGLQCDKSLGVTPLQDVENTCDSRRYQRRNVAATSYVEILTDSEFDMESSLNCTADSHNVSSFTKPQPHINKCLSPRPPESDVDTPTLASPLPDWKQSKPVRTREKLDDESSFREPPADKAPGRKKKKGKKAVKLKFKKSGEDVYEVTRQNITGESMNTTASEQQFDASRSDVEEKSSKKTNKDGNDSPLLTPLRFTRHMSKDLSITPELFQKIVSGSPKNKSRHHLSPLKRSTPLVPDRPSTPTQKAAAHLWRVESVKGSPTLKTFIRVGKEGAGTPSASPKLRPSLASPSVSSMLFLATSPIVNKEKKQVKPSTSYAQHDDDSCSSRRESLRRRRSSSGNEAPAPKRLRSRSPPPHRVKRRASKRLYK